MKIQNRRGFTLIEVLITIGIMAIIMATIAAIHLKAFRIYHVCRKDMPIQESGQRLINSAINGEAGDMGLLGAKSITNIAIDDITFVDKNNDSIRYYLDTSAQTIYRTVNGGADEEFFDPNDKVDITSFQLTYYDENENITAVPSDVRRVEISAVINDKNAQRAITLTSSVRPRNL